MRVQFPRWAPVAAGFLIGAVIGAATAVVQPWVPQPWSALVNSSSPWLLGGFTAGALSVGYRERAAVAAGLAVCLAEVGAYYAAATIGNIPVTHSYVIFWFACAVTGGPVSGAAGWAWRRGTGRGSAAGRAFPAGTFLAEGIGAYGLRLHYPPAVVIFLVIGVLLLALVSSRSRQGWVYAWTAVFVIAGALVYGPLLNAVVGIKSGGISFGP
jgi:hypothetical protein